MWYIDAFYYSVLVLMLFLMVAWDQVVGFQLYRLCLCHDDFVVLGSFTSNLPSLINRYCFAHYLDTFPDIVQACLAYCNAAQDNRSAVEGV